MTTADKRKARLLEELKNKEYRDSYISSNIDVGVAFQIRALRKQRKLTQEELAQTTKMKQERISALENPSRAPSLSTLKKIANGLEIGLMVRFVAISDVIKWKGDMSENSLEALSYNDDPYFKESLGEENILQEEVARLIEPSKQQGYCPVIDIESLRRVKSPIENAINPVSGPMEKRKGSKREEAHKTTFKYLIMGVSL